VGTGLVVLLLGLLGFAETGWLHQLPRDRASRVTLIALPEAQPATSGTGSDQSLSPDWSAHLLEEATDRDLIVGVIEKLDLRDGTTGQPLAPAALAADLRLGSECVDVRIGDGPPRRGLMLYAVVRSDGAIEPDAVAQAWSEQFVRHSRATFPGLAIQPATSLGVPYELCR
jgi:hypothetical protein